MIFLGIDPGLNGTLGWVVVQIDMVKKGFKVVCLRDCGLINVNRVGYRVAAGTLATIAERHRVSEAMIEDFFYWNTQKATPTSEMTAKRPASRRTVEKMQFLIGYLAGFLSARYIPVEIVHPRRWRARVKPEELLGFEKELPDIPAKKRQHVLDATGIILGELRARL